MSPTVLWVFVAPLHSTLGNLTIIAEGDSLPSDDWLHDGGGYCTSWISIRPAHLKRVCSGEAVLHALNYIGCAAASAEGTMEHPLPNPSRLLLSQTRLNNPAWRQTMPVNLPLPFDNAATKIELIATVAKSLKCCRYLPAQQRVPKNCAVALPPPPCLKMQMHKLSNLPMLPIYRKMLHLIIIWREEKEHCSSRGAFRIIPRSTTKVPHPKIVHALPLNCCPLVLAQQFQHYPMHSSWILAPFPLAII